MKEYLLILKGDGMKHLSPDELQKMLKDYQTWVEQLGDKYLGGQRLEENGAFLSAQNEEVLTDGPFLEPKEIIAGFFLIQANDLEEAVQIVQSSPHLGFYQIEVRPIVFPKMK
ncbi:MAG: YciI family protein [Saprospiraceae bacterium]